MRERVRLYCPCGHQRGEPGFVADIRSDGAAHEARYGELRESALGEITDPDHPDGGEVPRPALGEVDGLQSIDEPLWNCVSRSRTADDHRCTVGNEPGGFLSSYELQVAVRITA